MEPRLLGVRGTFREARFALALLGLLLLVCVATFIAPPAGRTSWLLEVTPGLLLVAVLAAWFPQEPLSRWVYICVFLHVLVLIYGGVYTYAQTPLGNWARDAFGLSRNPYDRVGHFALGFFPAFLAREVLLRNTLLQRGRWLNFLVLSVMLSVGAFWELIEWWAALLLAPNVGTAFLGMQGDVWDAQWDMFLALVGAIAALALFSPLHDRSMRSLAHRSGRREQHESTHPG
ncbi:MAG: DUF2238 domain-containing protein [Myxococcaceae bacterium]